ncbi:GGDEF domain-containing protein [Vibrio penaeicida]|uniref:GGDEF domain-containing protein n=1 Tax=Vibrio penaeicida TaxID=104609 RepID=UPI00352B5F06
MNDLDTLEQELKDELHDLKCKLDHARLSHRDSLFKFKREQNVLKRIVANLSDACKGNNQDLDKGLSLLKQDLEHQQDVTKLIPKLVVIERMLKQNTVTMEKKTIHLDERIKHSGETLQRIPGLPAQLKRDLRNLLHFPSRKLTQEIDQAIRLLGIYERATKIMASNSRNNLNLEKAVDQEIFDRLSEELQNLITELDFDGESGELLTDIRAKLLIGVPPNELFELILQILKLVIQGTHFERKTSEQFLDQVNTSLNTAIKNTSQNIEQSLSYSEHRKMMHFEINDLVSQGKSNLESDLDAEALKLAIAPLLDKIGSLTERLQHIEKREQTLTERLSYSHNQLEALQEVTQDYRRRLQDQAQRLLLDPLTKVYNRAALADKLELEYRRWIRAQHSFRILLLDIDNFKTLNDSFGYSAGDKALKIIARTIKKAVKDTDIVARFSGEEFLVLLPDQVDSETHVVTQKIQAQISKLPFKFRDQNITITASAVCAVFGDTDTPEEVLERLQLGLKNAKRTGPNQLIWL